MTEPRWEISFLVGPCSEDEAVALLGDMLDAGGRLGAVGSLAPWDERSRAVLADRVSTLEGVVAAAKACAILERDPARSDVENAEIARCAQAFRAALAGLGADPATQEPGS
jgi:hypothetical protein